jgi:hypothetical protein
MALDSRRCAAVDGLKDPAQRSKRGAALGASARDEPVHQPGWDRATFDIEQGADQHACPLLRPLMSRMLIEMGCKDITVSHEVLGTSGDSLWCDETSLRKRSV